jgi:hypothetical protein
MELNITSLADVDAPQYSASCMEMGQDAGRITWAANVADAPDLLDTDEKKEAARDHFKSYGAWTAEEIAAWTDRELNAILHQDIMAAVREAPAILDGITFHMDEGEWFYVDESWEKGLSAGPFDSRSEAYTDACPVGVSLKAESLTEIDWLEYEEEGEAGTVSSRLFRGDDGSFYFYLGT